MKSNMFFPTISTQNDKSCLQSLLIRPYPRLPVYNIPYRNHLSFTVDALPSQTGNSGKFLTTDGTDASWEEIATGNTTATGIWENSNTISSNYTITTNYNAMSVGPITVASGVTVTVPSGSTWVII